MPPRLAVTGGLGFIGSAFVRRAVTRDLKVLNIDSGTYAGNESRLRSVDASRLETVRLDVNSDELAQVLKKERPQALVHFAAETHVTRSEDHAERFFHSNVEGTRNVLEAAKLAGVRLVVHVSTDEVYGPCDGQPFREQDKLPGDGRATSAYAKSKSVADDLARAYSDELPVIIVRPTNCYGPWQHPEKAVARWTARALLSQPIPVWGDGRYVRDWMFVDDACAGIELLIERGSPGEIYNLAPEGPPVPNAEVAKMIARLAGPAESLVYLTDYDRVDHDRRYAVDASRMRALGWRPGFDLEAGLTATIRWFQDHRSWWETLLPTAEELYRDAAVRGPVPQ